MSRGPSTIPSPTSPSGEASAPSGVTSMTNAPPRATSRTSFGVPIRPRASPATTLGNQLGVARQREVAKRREPREPVLARHARAQLELHRVQLGQPRRAQRGEIQRGVDHKLQHTQPYGWNL